MPRTMKRLPRILLDAATVVSLALCIATLVLWERSYSAERTLTFQNSHWHERQYRHFATGLLADSGGAYLFCLRRSVLISEAEAEDGSFRARNRGSRMFHYGRGECLGYPDRTDYAGYHVGGFAVCGGEPVGAVTPIGLFETHVTYRDGFVVFPLWFAACVLAALPAVVTCSRWRALRLGRGLCCPNCNYDLRATPHRCPECGTTPTTSNI